MASGLFDGLSVRTDRLLLRPVSEEVARAALARERQVLARLVGAAVPAEWPGDVCAILAKYADALACDSGALGWGPWLAIETEANAVVGDLGFKGRPGNDRTVEIGFATLSAERNRGIATEATRALVAWALEHDEVDAVLAECTRENVASARVLEKVGLRPRGSRGTLLTWQIGPTRRPGTLA